MVTLALTVFAINTRHLLVGAALYPWLRHLSPTRRYGVMVLASDANWALTVQTFGRGQPALGLLLGGGLALWLFWVLGTWLGTQVGDLIADALGTGHGDGLLLARYGGRWAEELADTGQLGGGRLRVTCRPQLLARKQSRGGGCAGRWPEGDGLDGAKP